jgi:hypothetical protein
MRRSVAVAILVTIGVSGCALPGQRQQLDLLWARFAQQGPAHTAAFAIPAGRYTVFLRQFPVDCLTNVAMARERGVVASGVHGSVFLVQTDLAGVTYHFDVLTSRPDCAWEIQTVLNSVSGGTVPRAPTLDIPHPAPVSVSSQTTDSFDVAAVGAYSVTYQVGPGPNPCSFNLRLLGRGSLLQPIDAGGAGRGGSKGIVLLSPGRWRVDAATLCAWTVRVGPNPDGGGGATGF